MNPSTKILVTLVLALGLVLAGASASFAAVWTDQPDYAPGSQVTIHGDNSDGASYLAGEPVFVDVWGPNSFHVSSEPNNPTAGANGAWSWQFTLWNSANAVGEYRYTATGRTSSVSQSGMFSDADYEYRIEQTSIYPSTGVCESTITVHATLQICKYPGWGCTSWAPAEGKYLKFGFGNNTSAATTWSLPTQTDANGHAAANIKVPNGAVSLWAWYALREGYNYIESIAFNTPTLTLAVSDATYDGNQHGKTVTLTNACGSWRPQYVAYSGGVGTTYRSDSAPTNAGSYQVEAVDYWGDVFIYGYKEFIIARAPASVTPNDFTRQYSDQNPILTGSFSGFLAKDGVTASYNTTANPASAPGDYDVTATLSPPAVPNAFDVLDNYDVTDNMGTLRIIKEDAHVSFDPTNPATLQASAPGGSLNAGALTLKVNVQEQPDLPTETAADGDINDAGLTVTLAPSAGGDTITLNCSALAAGPGYVIKTFTCTNGVAIPVGAYEVTASVTGNTYVGVGYDVFTVDDPSPGFATGGGWFYWPGTGDKTNFGFTTKYHKSGNNLQGSLLVIRHHQDGTISRIKGNAPEELKLRNAGGCSIATFSGKATYKTWDAALRAYVNSGGNAFSVYAEDCNNPGSGVDSFWVRSVGNLALPMPAPSNKVQIGGGNIAVAHAAKE